MDTTTFRSKVDALVCAAWAAPLALFLLGLTVKFLNAGASPTLTVLMAALPVGLLAIIPFALARTTYYRFESYSLEIRGGPLYWSIPFRDIRGIKPARSMGSGPALSLDRLRIDYGRNKSILVSPRDQQEFLSQMETHRRNAA